MKKFFIALAVVAMMSAPTMANTVAQDCGCGLGKVLLGDKEGLVWNLLGTCLNGTSGNQTFGMSTGTLGCGPMDKFVQNEKMDSFVADNLDNIAIDIAAGNGESLSALAELAQVSVENQDNFFAQLKANFDNIYPTANVDHKHVVTTINNIVANI
ncbi:MAG: DUF3015 domain-containing protein [Deltaproteobacteria bacterium]|nr:DUF3015 domain-containing protein [Deltaproteobacteria bacterium]